MLYFQPTFKKNQLLIPYHEIPCSRELFVVRLKRRRVLEEEEKLAKDVRNTIEHCESCVKVTRDACNTKMEELDVACQLLERELHEADAEEGAGAGAGTGGGAGARAGAGVGVGTGDSAREGAGADAGAGAATWSGGEGAARPKVASDVRVPPIARSGKVISSFTSFCECRNGLN